MTEQATSTSREEAPTGDDSARPGDATPETPFTSIQRARVPFPLLLSIPSDVSRRELASPHFSVARMLNP